VAFGAFNKGAEGAPMAEINMIPLIDVMLVLLVIFIITAPLLTHAVSRKTSSLVSRRAAKSTGTASAWTRQCSHRG
jgi:biopolymer transport protein ExbD